MDCNYVCRAITYVLPLLIAMFVGESNEQKIEYIQIHDQIMRSLLRMIWSCAVRLVVKCKVVWESGGDEQIDTQ